MIFLLVIFLNWSLVFYGTQINPSYQLSTTISPKILNANVYRHPSDEINDNINRFRSTNFHNTFYTQQRKKNRKNKQKNYYYIKYHYYPLNPTSSSRTVTNKNDRDEITMSKTSRIKPFLSLILMLITMLNHI